MKEYTVYELEASDKLYHVTDDNKIEEITLTDDHFVEEFDDNFWCYLAHDKSHIIISKDNSNYYINQAKSAEAFTKFKKTIKKFEEDGPVTVKIETRDGLTFTVDEFESYLQTQIAKLTDK